jgi:hypothetical protein
MEEETRVVSLKEGEIFHSIKVIHNTKGYNWEVRVEGTNLDEVLIRVKEVESILKSTYGGKD